MVSSLATFGLLFLFGRRWKNPRTGILAAIIFATCILPFGLAPALGLRLSLAFWFTLAFYAGSGILMERLPERIRRFGYLWVIALAGGFLNAGLMAVMMPILVIGLAIGYSRSWVQLKKIRWPQTVIVGAAIVAGGFLVWPAAGDRSMLMGPAMPERHVPFYFNLTLLVVGFLPWTLLLPEVARSAFRHQGVAVRKDPVKALLILWTLVMTTAVNLIPSFAMGVAATLPPVALLCGDLFDEAFEVPTFPRWAQQGTLFWAVLLCGAVALLKFPGGWVTVPENVISTLRSHGSALALLISLCVMGLVGSWGMRRVRTSFMGLVVVQVLLVGVLFLIVSLARVTSAYADEPPPADLEMSDVELPKLVLREEPGGRFRLPGVIAKKDEWKGVQCGVQEARVAVFRHADKWATFWEKGLAPYSPKFAKTPEINFEKEMVVGVFLGARSTPNFEIEIRSIKPSADTPEILIVKYKEVKSMQAVFTPPFTIQPFHMRKVPAFSGEITFDTK